MILGWYTLIKQSVRGTNIPGRGEVLYWYLGEQIYLGGVRHYSGTFSWEGTTIIPHPSQVYFPPSQIVLLLLNWSVIRHGIWMELSGSYEYLLWVDIVTQNIRNMMLQILKKCWSTQWSVKDKPTAPEPVSSSSSSLDLSSLPPTSCTPPCPRCDLSTYVWQWYLCCCPGQNKKNRQGKKLSWKTGIVSALI